MRRILQFNISYEDGAYTAHGVNAPIVTFSHTFEELQQNIREAAALFFEGEEAEGARLYPITIDPCQLRKTADTR